MFDLGVYAIDTKKKAMVEVLAKLDGIEDLYVVEDSDIEECYIVKASNLIPYDKYWFDRNP